MGSICKITFIFVFLSTSAIAYMYFTGSAWTSALIHITAGVTQNPRPRTRTHTLCACIHSLSSNCLFDNSNSLLVKASLTDCLQYQKIFKMALNELKISSTNKHGNYR